MPFFKKKKKEQMKIDTSQKSRDSDQQNVDSKTISPNNNQ